MAPQQTTHSRGKSRLAILTASLRCRATSGGYRGRLRCQRVVRRKHALQEPRAIKIIGHAIAMLQLGPARQLREYPVCRRNCRWAVWLQGPGLGEGGAVGRGRAAERERGARGREGSVRDGERESGTTVGDRLAPSSHAHGKKAWARSKPRAGNPARHTVNGQR
ncbi:hypothetical protein COCVIDRAFT_18928 [Bipolaris victoriae FI3]|uniref:Uncharacterized protein n=1 Tax=Bipolaris victoriae (strain FI3) TaxID=930091 RepID=W7DZZ5_BIPV3|nr:hypothetical protein COCVIDRAFT_18928 [Bipolaris victoriae FI3]